EWDKPRAFDSIMRIRDLTPASTSFEDEEKHFTLAELHTLYAAADSRTRAYMLVALNCAYYPEDFADLRPEHVVPEAPRTYLGNKRKKAGVKRSHLLWTLTAVAIIDHAGVFGSGFKASTFAKVWAKVRKAAGVPGALFKHLRHSSSQLVKELADSETSSVH